MTRECVYSRAYHAESSAWASSIVVRSVFCFTTLLVSFLRNFVFTPGVLEEFAHLYLRQVAACEDPDTGAEDQQSSSGW